jgi:peptidoglycan-N-acetylmuramic acid deacetylase
MKLTRIMAVGLVMLLALAMFAGCVSRNKNDNVAPGFGVPESQEPMPEPAPEPIPQPIAPPPVDEPATPATPATPGSVTEPALTAMSADFSKIGALSREKNTGFTGGDRDSLNRPSAPLLMQKKYAELGAQFIVPGSKKIYLTFDEGYENGYTSRILDTLKEKNVKAVFFITYPYAKTETALVKRMIDEGHTLGNHSTKHRNFPDMPLQDAADDLSTLHDYVLANYGYEMWLFRPPEGSFSEQTLGLAQSLGYQTVLWSFAYRDWEPENQMIAIEAVDRILSNAHPGEICLLHAVSRTNAEILGEVIDTLRDRGLEFADYFGFQ